MDALERVLERVRGWIADAEAGRPIDAQAEAQALELETVAVGLEFVRDSLAAQAAADAELAK